MPIRRSMPLAPLLALVTALGLAASPAHAHDGAATAASPASPLLRATAPPATTAQEDSEVVALLRDLVRLDTGNEGLVAELLRARLAPLGFEVDVIPTPAPGKSHLIARLRAADPVGKPILLAGHADVVGVERDLWTLDPFAAIRRGDYLYGRGTLDFKGGLAAFAVAAMRIARSGAPLERDIVLLAEADEEGGSYGTPWLAEREWSKLDAAFSLNEGGWFLTDEQERPRFVGISTADRNSLSVLLETRGTSTHSSRPLPDFGAAPAHARAGPHRAPRHDPGLLGHRPPAPADLRGDVRRGDGP